MTTHMKERYRLHVVFLTLTNIEILALDRESGIFLAVLPNCYKQWSNAGWTNLVMECM